MCLKFHSNINPYFLTFFEKLLKYKLNKAKSVTILHSSKINTLLQFSQYFIVKGAIYTFSSFSVMNELL